MNGTPTLRFGLACGQNGSEFRRTPVATSDWCVVESVEGAAAETVETTVELDTDSYALAFVRKGTTLFRAADDYRWWLVPPKSVCLARGPLRHTVRIARGEHMAHLIGWRSEACAALSDWLGSRWPKSGSSQGNPELVTQPVSPVFHSAADRLRQALRSIDTRGLPLIGSVVHECVAHLASGESSLGLAPIPFDVPDALEPLIEKVKGAPFRSWSLKDAADEVGYSPFHFSRVFKAAVGYGFHEFAERCRTEFAVDLLLGSDKSIDLVATEAGFGTTQGLRESVKEYLGLVPSELRREPEAARR